VRTRGTATVVVGTLAMGWGDASEGAAQRVRTQSGAGSEASEARRARAAE
jgi:hypothetical protein